MTTIAYRKGVLAADTGLTSGGGRNGRVFKIARRSDGKLAGACGTAVYMAAFLKWFVAYGDEPPEAKSDQHSIDKGVVISRDGVVTVYEPGGSFTIDDLEYFAMGSGRPEALGAMFAGADAETAVFAAMAHDEGTYGDVTSVSFGDEVREQITMPDGSFTTASTWKPRIVRGSHRAIRKAADQWAAPEALVEEMGR